MKIAIIGAGWYGCHIAMMLKNSGIDVTIYEKESTLFAEASGNNQFRLHLGLHYARSGKTRYQSRDGFYRFSERYPSFSRAYADNYYFIPKDKSLIDFDTYFSIMLSSGIAIEKLPLKDFAFLDTAKFEGAISCQERVLVTSSARKFFSDALQNHLRLSTPVAEIKPEKDKVRVNGEWYDYCVDASWGAFLPPNAHYYFEPTLLLYYRLKDRSSFPAITLVDGQLWSIYPTEEDGLYTVSSVTHTPLGRFHSKADAYSALKRVAESDIQSKRAAMETEIREYFPAFDTFFHYEGPQFSVKTKPIGFSDDRTCSVVQNGPVFQVNSGKIDTIFHAADIIVGAVTATI